MLTFNRDKDNKTDLAEHVQNVMDVLIDSYPDEAIKRFEEVSYLLKKGEDLSKFLKVKDERNYSELAGCLSEYIEKGQGLFKAPVAEEEGEEPPE